MGSEPHRVLYFWHSVGNKFLTLVSNMFTDINLTDMETGYKVFRSEILERILYGAFVTDLSRPRRVEKGITRPPEDAS
jgi:hypothetical protein